MQQATQYNNVATSNTRSKFYAKVFGYMGLGLVITGVVAALVGFLFTKIFPITNTADPTKDANAGAYLTLLIVSLIAYIPILIWIQIATFKGKGKLVPPFIIYTIIMGVLISSATMFVPFYLIGIAFGITCLAFMLMGLIGFLTKGSMNILPMIAFGIIAGIGLMCLFNLLFMLIFPSVFQSFYWFVSFGLFAAVILITIFDLHNVKQLAEAGETSSDVALYCAFSLYVDFIYIFLKILLIIIRLNR